jgi:hypothetical protein
MLNNSFSLLGLDKIHQTIYDILLDNPGAKARMISQKTETPKSTVIEKLYELEKIGLASKKEDKNSFIFFASDPLTIIGLINQKEKDFEESKKRSFLEINQLRRNNESNLPKVEFYEGRQNIKKLYMKTLEARGEIFSFGDIKNEINYLGGYLYDFWKLRNNTRSKLTSLIPDNPKNRETQAGKNIDTQRSTLFYPDNLATLSEIVVYDNVIQLINFEEEFGILIENQKVAESIKNLLKLSSLSCKKVY